MKSATILTVFLATVIGLVACKSDRAQTASAPHDEKAPVYVMDWNYAWDASYPKRPDGSQGYWRSKRAIAMGATVLNVIYGPQPGPNRPAVYSGYCPPKLLAEVMSNCQPELVECHQHGIKVIGFANTIWFHPDMMKLENVDSSDLFALDNFGKPVINNTWEKSGVYISCVSNPKWLRLQTEMMQTEADAGFDGVQLDLHPYAVPPGYNCHCHYCEALWKEYSKKVFGVEKPMPGQDAPKDDPSKLDFTKPEDRVYREWRHQRLALFLKTISNNVRRTHPDFLFTLNHAAGDPDYAYLCEAGVLPIPSSELWHLNFAEDSSLYGYRMTEAMSGEKCIGLINGGNQITPDYRFRVGMGEAYAGGGAFYIGGAFTYDPDHKPGHEAARYLRENKDLYTDTSSEAEVGVLYSWRDQEFAPNITKDGTQTKDYDRCRRAGAILARKCVPYDIVVVEKGLKAKELARYRVIVSPELRLLSEKNSAAIKEYVKSGGRLMVIGAFGTLKEKKTEYVKQPPTLTTWTGKECEKPWWDEFGSGKLANVPIAWKGSGETNMVVSRGFEKAADYLGLYSQLRVKASTDVEATVRGKGNTKLIHIMRFGPPDKATDKSVQVDYELPKGYHVVSAAVCSPEYPTKELTLNWKESEGRFQADLNQLGSYALVSVKVSRDKTGFR